MKEHLLAMARRLGAENPQISPDFEITDEATGYSWNVRLVSQGRKCRGDKLTPNEQAEVLEAFCYRSTPENRKWPAAEYPLQFANDREWLENTTFFFTAAGVLKGSCESNPTWPNNPELRQGHSNA